MQPSPYFVSQSFFSHNCYKGSNNDGTNSENNSRPGYAKWSFQIITNKKFDSNTENSQFSKKVNGCCQKENFEFTYQKNKYYPALVGRKRADL